MDVPDVLNRPPVRAVGAGVGLAALALLVGFALVLGVLSGLRLAGVALTPLVLLVVSLLLFQGVTMGGVATAYLRYRRLSLAYVGLDRVLANPFRDGAVAIVGYVLAFGAALTGAVVVSALGLQAGTNQAAEFAFEDPEVLLLLIPAAIVLIGPAEELLFRGIIQRRLREGFGPAAGVALAAALFAFVHVTAVTGGVTARLTTVAVLFLPSLVFGSIYEYTGNLAVPALVHGAYNATLFTGLYFIIKLGGVAPGGAGDPTAVLLALVEFGPSAPVT
jgi:hypothetical protein